jgi:hypothetical protein
MWFARDEGDGQTARTLLRARDDEAAAGAALGSVRFQRYKVGGVGGGGWGGGGGQGAGFGRGGRCGVEGGR